MYNLSVDFLRKIGIKKGMSVLDFGCGEGHYTIPLSKVVGEKGKIFAVDKDSFAFFKVSNILKKENLNNVHLLNACSSVPAENCFFDAALYFDVIHYERNRTKIYSEILKTLKKGGKYFVYPKLCSEDFPLMEFSSPSIKDIIKEISSACFQYEKTIATDCLHDTYINPCKILFFSKT